MKTIGIVTPGFPKDEQDTTCLPAVQQFVLSAKTLFPDLRIVILAFQYPFEEKEYTWYGLRVIALGGKNRPKLYRLFTWLKAYRRMQQLKKENKIIGILSLWLSETALVSNYFSKWNGIPHFMWLHGQDAKADNRYIRLIRPKGREVIAISEFIQKEFYKNHHQLPFLVAENGVNPMIFPELNTSLRPIDILGAGSLIHLKNYALFIEIISEIKKTYPTFRAVIAGDGVEKERLTQLSGASGLESHLRFVGQVAHKEVLDLMANARIFLHPSDFEGNSTVVIEALYSGCEVISKTSLSHREINHLHIKFSKQEMTDTILRHLKENSKAERVTFHAMDDTAQRIIGLFLK